MEYWKERTHGLDITHEKSEVFLDKCDRNVTN
jgi:hypothetical protein